MSEQIPPTTAEPAPPPRRTGPVTVRITDLKIPFSSVLVLVIKFYAAAFIVGIFFFILTTLLLSVIGPGINSIFSRLLFGR